MSRQYSRTFITLTHDWPGYGLNNRFPAGRCVIEAREGAGKMSVAVQDMQPDIIYKAYIICCDKTSSTAVSAGTLSVDAKGRGELKWQFDPESVGGSAIPVERFNVAAVLVPNSGGLISPLLGFKDAPVNWRSNFIDFSKVKAAVPEPDANLVKSAVPPPCEIVRPAPLQAFAVLTDEERHALMGHQDSDAKGPDHKGPSNKGSDSKDSKASNNKGEKVLKPPFAEIPKEPPKKSSASREEGTDQGEIDELQKTFLSMAERIHKEFEDLRHYTMMTEEEFTKTSETSRPAAPAGSMPVDAEEPLDIRCLCRHNEETAPFAKQARPIRWVKISINELSLLPINTWEYANHPIVGSAYYSYGHFILGEETSSGKRYYLGVPCTYEPDDRFTMRSLEFMQFKCLRDVRPTAGEFGYWLMLLP
jgi:hypothetical protein